METNPDTGEGLFKFDAAGANRTLELIGKHLGMFVEKSDVTIHKGLPELMEDAEKRLTEKDNKPKDAGQG